LVKDEKDKRIELESYLKLNSINYNVEELELNDEENFLCDFCTYYNYLSLMICNGCKKKGCLTHAIQCKCLPTDFTLKYRYSTSVKIFLIIINIRN
jgi:hypothetical protein